MSTLAEIRTPDGAWSLEAEDGALWLHYVVGGKRTVVPVTWEALAMMEAVRPSRRGGWSVASLRNNPLVTMASWEFRFRPTSGRAWSA